MANDMSPSKIDHTVGAVKDGLAVKALIQFDGALVKVKFVDRLCVP